MKKNFFKKLSFVLALAMIVSVIAPAAGAFAASAPKLNSKKQYLHLDKDGANDFDFNIKNKVSGWKYDWSSANDKVATVKSNGLVTAKGVGTTKISVVIVDKDGEEKAELTATVVVRDNIKTVAITNKPAGDKLAVGVENDFNRSFTTVSGSTTKTSSVTRWTVDNGATINDSGVFVATAAGEYTITARAFQSKAKYTSWVSDNAKYASYVLATDTYKVTVAPSMTGVKQVDEDTFAVTFDSAVTDAKAKLTFSQLISGIKVNVLIKEVKMDAANKVATVDVYVPFAEEGVFVVDYPTLASVQFTAAKKDATLVTSIAVITTKVEIGEAKEVEVALYNKDGVNIATADLLNRVSIESSNSASYTSGRELSLFAVGDTTTITATYHTYVYDTAGAETGALKATGIVTCIDDVKDNVGGLNAYTVTANATPNWKDVKHSIAAGDMGVNLFVQLKGTDVDGNELLTDNVVGSANEGLLAWEYTSSNKDVVIVDAAGNLYPAKEGSAVIVVKYNEVIVGTATITVTGARKVASITLNSYSFILSNDDDVLDTKDIKVTVKDQLNDDYTGAFTVTTEANGTVPAGLLTSLAGADGTDADPITFEGATIAKGTYSYKVTVTDTDNDNAKFVKYITVTIQEPKFDDDVYYYRVEASDATVDMNIKPDEDGLNEWRTDVTLSLFGYATNGVKNVRVNLAVDDFTLEVKDPNGDVVVLTGAGLNVLELVALNAGAVEKAPKGTYKITATQLETALVSEKAINATYVTVTDTQEAPVLTVNKTYSKEAGILAAINDCLAISLHGDDINVAALGDITRVQADVDTIFVSEVRVYEVIGAATIEHKVKVNRTINYAQ